MKGSVTEVIYDFVFTPPRAQIGFQSSVIPDTGTHLRTALFLVKVFMPQALFNFSQKILAIFSKVRYYNKR